MDQIGKFQPNKILGRGASGTVYLALDTFSGMEVALKVLDQDVIKNPDFDRANVVQFMNEASFAGKLKHPHIASILEASVSEDSGYIAIEYVPGGDLSQYVLPGSLFSQEEVVEIAFKSCGALDYAFQQGIVHRDLKPENILLVNGTNIKVSDFGAAYLINAPETEGETIGSPSYMSPEQVRGEPLSFHSDMYTLGVVLYQLLTGELPCMAPSLNELFAKILKEQPVVPSSHRPELDAAVDHILLRMMAKGAEQRYPSWNDLASDLAKIGHPDIPWSAIPDREKFVAIKKVQLLGNLDDADLWELVHACKWSRIPSHTAIVTEGMAGKSLFFLGSGSAKVTKQGRLLNLLKAGECVGEMSYIKEGEIARQATVESTTEVLLAELEKETLDKVSLKCRYQISLALMNSLVDRLMLSDERLIRAG